MEQNVAPQEHSPQEKKVVKISEILKKFTPKILVILGVIAVCVTGFFAYKNYRGTRDELSKYKDDPNVMAFKEKYDLIGKVSNHVILPANEDPTIATITNAHRLAGQAFFTHAENGDKIIIFPISGRAILYRPNTDKIIEAAPVNITDLEKSVNTNAIKEEETGQDESVDENAKEDSEKINPTDPTSDSTEILGDEDTAEVEEKAIEVKHYQIGVLNSTDVVGLAGEAANLIEETFTSDGVEIEIISKANAIDVYSNTVVYYAEEDLEEMAQNIANLFEGTTTTDFPENEEEFLGDILVIRGQ